MLQAHRVAFASPSGARTCSITTVQGVGQSLKGRARVSLAKATAGFESSAPGAAQLASMAVVTLSTVVTGAFWWLVVVPSERASVSKRKRKGDLQAMLEELEKDETRKAERWFYTDWRTQLQQRKQLNAWGKQQQEGTVDQHEQQQSVSSTGTRQGDKQRLEETDQPSNNLLEPTYRTPTPRFLSLDNPLVFVFTVLTLMAAVTAVITGRLHVQ